MFVRARWLTMGAAVGFGASVWAQHKVKTTVARYRPLQVGGDIVDRARDLGTDFRDALAEGREAMRAREAELRANLAGRSQSLEINPAVGAGRAPAVKPAAQVAIDAGAADVEARPMLAARSRR